MNANALAKTELATEAARAPDAARPKGVRRGEAIRELKKRDNYTNFYHIGFVYFVIALAIGFTIWSYHLVDVEGLGWWWDIPTTIAAITVIGASQHQFGGVIHEGTHFILFENKILNELASDWLAAFPIYTSTFQFRLHHLAHHQFINDPVRDPDWAQLHDSGHDLDFPITHFEMLRALGKQIWLPNLFRYTIARARYSALGTVNNPYVDRERRGERLPTLAGVLYAIIAPAAVIPLVRSGHGAWAFAVLGFLTAVVITYFARLDEDKLPHAHVETVISHRTTNISRIVYMAILYAALTAIEVVGWGQAWRYFGLLWVAPLFTTFPLFMIMRQWVQHGNADRGRYTNSRVFLVNPFIRYAVFPFGMDYHLPHHIYASVPHYKLHGLHELLLQDPEYREKGVVVEGYFNSPHGDAGGRNPTVIEVLGDKYAPKGLEEAYIDADTLEYAKVRNPDAIERENRDSLNEGR
ncbi:fatty acid desaturase [Hyphomicrobium denitrificans 1NES1]|uniref:Fatty acid desaturase n=1 Tax=Hyphomicrobium denitrificans 1NES1 TaxID=670307 RepID=N0B5C2_9HYPH|nr:fatty acid desaturase [Hyphomicrobium denitrificans]AGK58734.1 fatty acid desaturase [Hyphomicrobium denitrificans 1NES1]